MPVLDERHDLAHPVEGEYGISEHRHQLDGSGRPVVPIESGE